MATFSYGSKRWITKHLNFLEKNTCALRCSGLITDDKKYTCCIKIYRHKNCETYMSLYAMIHRRTDFCCATNVAKLSLSVRDTNNLIIKACDFTIVDGVFKEDKFIPWKGLSILRDIKIYAEIYIESPNSEVSKSFQELENGNPEVSGQESDITNDLSSLLTNPMTSDVVIYVNDREFKAHKNILATRSPVFADILENNMDVQLCGKIVIQHFSPDVVDIFLHFLYSGQADVPDYATAMELLKLAVEYGSLCVTLGCIDYLTQNLNRDNAADILLLADAYNLIALKNSVLDHILSNMVSTLWVDIFKIIENQRPRLLTELLTKLSTGYIIVKKP